MVGSVEVEGLRTTPSLARGGANQIHRKTRRITNAADHPTYQRKGREPVPIQVVPRMTKRILEDGRQHTAISSSSDIPSIAIRPQAT